MYFLRMRFSGKAIVVNTPGAGSVLPQRSWGSALVWGVFGPGCADAAPLTLAASLGRAGCAALCQALPSCAVPSWPAACAASPLFRGAPRHAQVLARVEGDGGWGGIPAPPGAALW